MSTPAYPLAWPPHFGRAQRRGTGAVMHAAAAPIAVDRTPVRFAAVYLRRAIEQIDRELGNAP